MCTVISFSAMPKISLAVPSLSLGVYQCNYHDMQNLHKQNPSRNSAVCIGLARNGGLCRLCFVMNIYCLLQLPSLHMAAEQADLGKIKELVGEGEDINIKDSGSGVSMHV